jgi:hypothetical protein
MGRNVFRKIRGYIKAKQFDVFIFIKNAQFGKDPKKIMGVFNSGPRGYGPGFSIPALAVMALAISLSLLSF